jgi:cyclophilin family peptidyl-prolyl cis-trans isomerase
MPPFRLAAAVRVASFALVALVLAASFAGCAENGKTTTPTATGTPTPSPVATPPAPTATSSVEVERSCTSRLDANKTATEPTLVFETSKGTIRITLFCDKAPITAQNIVDLAEARYYDGTRFHRVIKDFMDQGGDPLTRDVTQSSRWGTGGPGYTIVDEFYCADGTISNTHPASCASGLGLKHDKPGVMSMANTGRPMTGGSQFFLTAVPTPHLDGLHAIFGEVADAESLEVALAINRAPTSAGDRPNPEIVLQRASIDWG